MSEKEKLMAEMALMLCSNCKQPTMPKTATEVAMSHKGKVTCTQGLFESIMQERDTYERERDEALEALAEMFEAFGDETSCQQSAIENAESILRRHGRL